MTDYLLTKKEQEELYCKYVDKDDDVYVKAIAKAQDRKSRRLMLEQLEKEGLLNHNQKWVGDNPDLPIQEQCWAWVCAPDCRACAVLREVK